MPSSPPGWTRRDLTAAAALAVGFGILYFALQQTPRWSDGRSLIRMLETGRWSYHHFLFLPVAQVVYALARPLGIPAESVLHGVSALGSAAAVSALYLAAISLGFRRVTAGLTALLLASAPATWFYGTCIEVHSLQLGFAAGTVLWATRLDPRARPDAVLPTLLFCGLFGSHMTGAVWGPALFLLLFRHEGRWRLPRRLPVAVVILGLGVGAWVWATGAGGTGTGHALLGARKLLENWRFEYFQSEVLAPSGLLVPLGVVGAFLFARRDPGAWRAPLVRSSALLFLCFVPFAFTLHIAERGAYFISLLPLTCLCAGRALLALGRWQLLAGALLVALQVTWSAREVHRYEHAYPGWEWASALFEETDRTGLLVAYDREEWQAVWCHSDMAAISLKARRTKQNLGTFTRVATATIDKVLDQGEPVAITRSFYASPIPEVRQIVEALVARFGEPTPGRHEHYLFFPPRG